MCESRSISPRSTLCILSVENKFYMLKMTEPPPFQNGDTSDYFFCAISASFLMRQRLYAMLILIGQSNLNRPIRADGIKHRDTIKTKHRIIFAMEHCDIIEMFFFECCCDRVHSHKTHSVNPVCHARTVLWSTGYGWRARRGFLGGCSL